MNKIRLNHMIFMAICCDLGLVAKKIISPVANIVTESLHIPGGIATSFSLMFLIVAASIVRLFGCATLMSVVQSLLALSFGMVGSMGALAPIGYILPGIAIDLCLYFSRHNNPSPTSGILLSSVASSVCAALAANIIVFHLHGIVLLIYALVSATSGAICSLISVNLVERIAPYLNKSFKSGEQSS